MYDPLILSKRIFMQRIQDYVRHGYRHWTLGKVSPEKATRLVRKFVDYYRVDRDRNARHRARLRGEGSAYLLLYAAPGEDRITFILLVSAGAHPAHKLEKLKEAFDERSRVTLTGYELVRLTKPGNSQPVLTWRMTRQNYASWRDRIRKTVRSGSDAAVRQMINTLVRSPGFAGIRQQVKKLGQLLRAEWKRRRRKPSRPPAIPRIYYLQRLRTEGMHLSAYLRRYKALCEEARQSRKIAGTGSELVD